MSDELRAMHERYARRSAVHADRLYDPLLPSVYMMAQERQRVLARLLLEECAIPVSARRVVEIGCGSGAVLLELITLGFQPEHLVGVELQPERAAKAQARLPASVRIYTGDALQYPLPDEGFDMVVQSTAFTSILDDGFQARLAHRMWNLVAPGGGVLWYDFTVNNPRNPDVRGVPIRAIHRLFPEGRIRGQRVTLAPPIARRVTQVHPALYSVVNVVPWLRSHYLCWIGKETVR